MSVFPSASALTTTSVAASSAALTTPNSTFSDPQYPEPLSIGWPTKPVPVGPICASYDSTLTQTCCSVVAGLDGTYQGSAMCSVGADKTHDFTACVEARNKTDNPAFANCSTAAMLNASTSSSGSTTTIAPWKLRLGILGSLIAGAAAAVL